jgi:hypothetical protein
MTIKDVSDEEMLALEAEADGEITEEPSGMEPLVNALQSFAGLLQLPANYAMNSAKEENAKYREELKPLIAMMSKIAANPPNVTVDLSPLQGAMAAVAKAITERKVPEPIDLTPLAPAPVDLSPLLQQMAAITKALNKKPPASETTALLKVLVENSKPVPLPPRPSYEFKVSRDNRGLISSVVATPQDA